MFFCLHHKIEWGNSCKNADTIGKLSRGKLMENASTSDKSQMNATKRSKLPKSTNKGQNVRKLYILIGLTR